MRRIYKATPLEAGIIRRWFVHDPRWVGEAGTTKADAWPPVRVAKGAELVIDLGELGEEVLPVVFACRIEDDAGKMHILPFVLQP